MKTILIIDSSCHTLLMLQEEFAGAGYAVLTTESGQEALEILHDPVRPVDLVITNLRHSGPQGLAFIRLIKKARPGLPIICLTALSEYQELPAQERPFDAFVEKLSDLTALKDSVARFLGPAG